jgi:hypothetical protein
MMKLSQVNKMLVAHVMNRSSLIETAKPLQSQVMNVLLKQPLDMNDNEEANIVCHLNSYFVKYSMDSYRIYV